MQVKSHSVGSIEVTLLKLCTLKSSARSSTVWDRLLSFRPERSKPFDGSRHGKSAACMTSDLGDWGLSARLDIACPGQSSSTLHDLPVREDC